jgi:hypothetical protein
MVEPNVDTSIGNNITIPIIIGKLAKYDIAK